MKTFTLFIIVILSLSLSVNSYAIEQKSTSEKEYITILNSNPNNRHKMPSALNIECHYSIGHIRFTLPSNTEYLYIIIGDEDTPVWTGFVTRTTPDTDIPVLSGEYAIICRTDGNQIFSGMLKF